MSEGHYNLIVDPEKHAEEKAFMQNFFFGKVSHEVEPEPKPALNLHELFEKIYKIKALQKTQEIQDIYFPSEEARDQFLSWMNNPETLLGKDCCNVH